MAAAFMRICLLGALFVFASARLLSVAATEQAVTPVQKVIELLEKLAASVEDDGRREAIEYDKFACFCKNVAGQKEKAVAKSEEHIEVLAAEIEALESDIADLNADIVELNDRIKELETEIETATKAREEEHDKYVVKEQDLVNAISALKKAIKVMQESKGEMEDAKLGVGLAQIKPDVKHAIEVGARHLLGNTMAQSEDIQKVLALIQEAKPGQVASYEYRSNDIIATLKGLLAKFKGYKTDLDQTEFDAQTAFDKKVLDLGNEKKFKEEDKTEKETLVADKTEEQKNAEQDKDAETKAMDADKAFSKELTTQCETRATEWDQRSKARASEISAISQCLETLKSGVLTNYDANKKLVGLASKHQTMRTANVTETANATKMTNATKPLTKHSEKTVKVAPSFLQLRGAGRGSAGAAVQRALQVVDKAANKLHSAVLSAVMTQAVMQEDHFVKVRALIKDLIARLQEDAKAEQTQKSFCDTEMKKEIDGRDAASLSIEKETATIAKKEALIETLKEEIAQLAEEIAATQKALNEATELRAEQKASNEKTIADAEAGKKDVELAIQILKEFYEPSLLQEEPQEEGYTPYEAKGSDRYGQTVGDAAPEMSYSGDYKGRTDESKGILGLLEVIAADFERTKTTVTDEEAKAKKAFEEFKTESEKTITDKTKEKKTKEGEIKDAKDAITTAKENLEGAEKEKKAAIKALDDLKVMCVEGEDSYAVRKEKREEEIEALKAAMVILDEWQTGL